MRRQNAIGEALGEEGFDEDEAIHDDYGNEKGEEQGEGKGKRRK